VAVESSRFSAILHCSWRRDVRLVCAALFATISCGRTLPSSPPPPRPLVATACGGATPVRRQPWTTDSYDQCLDALGGRTLDPKRLDAIVSVLTQDQRPAFSGFTWNVNRPRAPSAVNLMVPDPLLPDWPDACGPEVPAPVCWSVPDFSEILCTRTFAFSVVQASNTPVDAGTMEMGTSMAARFAARMVIGHELSHLINDKDLHRSHSFAIAGPDPTIHCLSGDASSSGREARADEFGIALACGAAKAEANDAGLLPAMSAKVSLDDVFAGVWPDDLCLATADYESMARRAARFGSELLRCTSSDPRVEEFATSGEQEVHYLESVLTRAQRVGWRVSDTVGQLPVDGQWTFAHHRLNAIVNIEVSNSAPDEEGTSRVWVLTGYASPCPVLSKLSDTRGHATVLDAEETVSGWKLLVQHQSGTDDTGHHRSFMRLAVDAGDSESEPWTVKVLDESVPYREGARYLGSDWFAFGTAFPPTTPVLFRGIVSLTKHSNGQRVEGHTPGERSRYAVVDDSVWAFEAVADTIEVSNLSSDAGAPVLIHLPFLSGQPTVLDAVVGVKSLASVALYVQTGSGVHRSLILCPSRGFLDAASLKCVSYDPPRAFLEHTGVGARLRVSSCNQRYLELSDEDTVLTLLVDPAKAKGVTVPALGVISCVAPDVLGYRKGRVDRLGLAFETLGSHPVTLR
jgi:hypothetical protein